MSKIRLLDDLDAETLRSCIDYDPVTGRFHRTFRSGVVKDAGSPDVRGYLRINILGTNYRAHRLAWLYVHGEWPACYIDHINGIVSDNRIINLRAVTPLENSQNCKTMRARLNKVQAFRSRA